MTGKKSTAAAPARTPAKLAWPQRGGSYRRHKDGSLTRQDEDHEAIREAAGALDIEPGSKDYQKKIARYLGYAILPGHWPEQATDTNTDEENQQ